MSYTILISGGSGFIGKNLIRFLAKTEKMLEIIVIDNFITSDPDYFYEFMAKFKDNDNLKITLFDFDITSSKLIPFIKERYNTINEIYHLASLASPIAYKRYPIKTLDTGYTGTKNLLDLALHYNSKFLLASTSEIYGDAKESPQNEIYYGNVNSFGERSCYDESKRIAESLVFTYKLQFNVDVRVARIFNTYGPEMSIKDGRIITEIIRHLICGTELIVFGDGTQTRSICYVDDTVQMLVDLMESDYSNPINIGYNVEMSVNDIVNTTVKNYEKIMCKKVDLQIKYQELTQDDPLVRQPCLKLNKEILGERVYTTIDEGITETINYFLRLM